MRADLTVVTPTLGRPELVEQLLKSLARQTRTPAVLVVIDAAPDGDDRTDAVVERIASTLPYDVHHIRSAGGTAIQRNRGIDEVKTEFLAFIDDDIRLDSEFFALLLEDMADDADRRIGGITGYITNQYIDASASAQWRWYRRLRAFSTYHPGAFDRRCGHPINRYIQPPHKTLRSVDVMGAGCALWRTEVFASGLRFDPFFVGYGMLEDAHLALRAGTSWELREDGRAHCTHLRAAESRPDPGRIAYMTAVNYRFLFTDVVRNRTASQELRFWWVQVIDLARLLGALVKRPSVHNRRAVVGKMRGMVHAWRRFPWRSDSPREP